LEEWDEDDSAELLEDDNSSLFILFYLFFIFLFCHTTNIMKTVKEKYKEWI